ncbi:endonuclease domain-containing protein [Butyricimonas paravirosa]
MTNPKITHNTKKQRDIRRELRQHGTPAEATLWKFLKGRQINNLRWRRQFSIETYILDFYCPAARLCIELDGASHFSPDGGYNDERQTESLWQKHGIRTLRFENKLIFEQPENILETIRIAQAKGTQQTPPSATLPPPL